ncbi:MAG TPA: hypothetical protein VFU15_16550, partial [Bacteroidia bacterium]|nr:hypothetical protein [Bacteroidia bacterium]
TAKPSYAFDIHAAGSGKYSATPRLEIGWSADLNALFSSATEPNFEASGSVTVMRKVNVFKKSGGVYITGLGKYSSTEPDVIGGKAGIKIPIGDQFILGGEYYLNYDNEHPLNLWQPSQGLRIYLLHR